MYIDAEVMKECLEEQIFNSICNNKKKIATRFGDVEECFNLIKDVKISLEKQKFPKVEGENKDIKSQNDDNVDRGIFAPSKIGLTEGERYAGIQYQQKYFQGLIQEAGWQNFISFPSENNKDGKDATGAPRKDVGEFVREILSIIGGFDEKGKMKDEYRILSNSYKNKDDFKSSLTSSGLCAWINSHFADNTLFFEFVEFVRECECKTIPEYDKIALCHPYSYKDEKPVCGKLSDCVIKNIEEEIKLQQEILAYRFPLKFLWMWAKRDVVIHPLSLMAFREFLKSEFMKEIFEELSKDQKFSELPYDDEKTMKKDYLQYAEKITNAKIEYFPDLWQKVSDAIIKKLYKEECQQQDKEELKKISLLISLLTLGETDMTNIDELLKTHKQIILYGVPGTGKTHSAKELIREWGKIVQLQQSQTSDQVKVEAEKKVEKKHDILKDWHFSNFKNGKDSPIVWEIMQFHPNTTYQDFIGGIIPKTGQDKNLTYEVESGKFKKFCECAGKEENKNKKFVFIIDEINRANLSEVLGELLYALEYRDEGITIPNFDKPFVIPNNVYIIGTMNNVDKSLSTFDLALRRRFGFYEIKPDLGALNEILSFNKETDGQNQQDSNEDEVSLISKIENYITRCENLNKKIIEKLGDKNAQIGQAYYGKIKHFLNQNEVNQVVTPFHLQKLWDYHLEPLLQEYVGFMDDGEKKVEYLKKVWLGKVEE